MEYDPFTVQAVWSMASHEQYQNWAGYYNDTLAALRYSTPERVAAVAHQRFGASDRLLELGAGTGLVGEALERLGSPLRLFGADISRAMLEQMTCTVYYNRQVVDASHPLPFEPDSFDGVICAGLLEYLYDPGTLLKNVLAVLAPGGRLIFTYAPAEHQAVEQFETTSLLLRHHPRAVADHLKANGLRVLAEETLEAYWNRNVQIYHQLVVCARAKRGARKAPRLKAKSPEEAN